MTVSMAGGEIGPGLWARVDLAKFQSSLKTCRNFQVDYTGGVKNRPGTQFVAETKTVGDRVRLIPFTFSNDQTYTIEAGDRYFRFYQNGAPILDLADVAAMAFGTGDGVETHFQLLDGATSVTTPRNVKVYIGGVEAEIGVGDNLLASPNAFEAAAWTKDAGATVTANNAAAPDSSTTADTLDWSA